MVFAGFLASLLYGGVSSLLVWIYDPARTAAYIEAFVTTYNCLVSGGLAIGTGVFVMLSYRGVPALIDRVFNQDALAATSYPYFRRRYLSVSEAAAFSAVYVAVAYGIFSICRFPIHGLGNSFLVIFACIQYALGVFVGRQIYFVAHIFRAISEVGIDRDLMKSGLSSIAGFVNIVSTMVVIMTYFHVSGFYRGPFEFVYPIGPSAKILLLLPLVIATPAIVVFNFYPRIVLRRLYDQSNEILARSLQDELAQGHLSAFARSSLEIEYDRVRKAEAKGQLELTLSDIPIAITIIVALIGLISHLAS
ncbi:MAG TPA: hypothetical protein VGD66_02240 [Allosphingosinicella sp.]